MEKKLYEVIDEHLKKYVGNDDFDIEVDEINAIFERFDKEVFKIEDNFKASQYLLKATTFETLVYLRSFIVDAPDLNIKF